MSSSISLKLSFRTPPSPQSQKRSGWSSARPSPSSLTKFTSLVHSPRRMMNGVVAFSTLDAFGNADSFRRRIPTDSHHSPPLPIPRRVPAHPAPNPPLLLPPYQSS